MPQISMAALVAAVRSGRWLVSFPTDTVPALAVRPDQAELIFAPKQRSQNKPCRKARIQRSHIACTLLLLTRLKTIAY